MFTYEKIKAIELTIFEYASEKFSECGIDAGLSEIIMCNVYRNFQEAAYHNTLFHLANNEQNASKRTSEEINDNSNKT